MVPGRVRDAKVPELTEIQFHHTAKVNRVSMDLEDREARLAENDFFVKTCLEDVPFNSSLHYLEPPCCLSSRIARGALAAWCCVDFFHISYFFVFFQNNQFWAVQNVVYLFLIITFSICIGWTWFFHQSTQLVELRRLVRFQLDLSLANRWKSNFSNFFGSSAGQNFWNDLLRRAPCGRVSPPFGRCFCSESARGLSKAILELHSTHSTTQK